MRPHWQTILISALCLGKSMSVRFVQTRAPMTAATSINTVAERLRMACEASVERPTAVLAFIAPRRDIIADISAISVDLGIQFIRLHLNQVVTPDQHLQFMESKPRLTAISGLETLAPSERDALVRLVYNVPRTLAVTWCFLEPVRARATVDAWQELKAVEARQGHRATRLEATGDIARKSTPHAGLRGGILIR